MKLETAMQTLKLFTMTMLAACASSALAGPTVQNTEVIGGFSGHGTAVHPENMEPEPIAYYGTDLGFTYTHEGKLQILFGDTWAVESYAPIEASTGSKFDDGFGWIDLSEWPDPSKITPDNIPVLRLGQNPGTSEMSAMNPGHAMDLGKTPMGGFSNGANEFAIFNLTKPRGCATDDDCDNGLGCDTGLGFAGAPFIAQENLTLSCVDGQPGCQADTLVDEDGAAVTPSGLCIDRSSTVFADSNAGRMTAAGIQQRIGMRSTDDPKIYQDTRDWLTTKFLNVTPTTVESFEPGADPSANDYRPAGGTDGNQRVFLWGRPGFVGVKALDRSLGLYFAYVDLPKGQGYEWKPMYFTGTKDGVPQFSANEHDAAPLDLDAAEDGVQAKEVHDAVQQMTVEWIEPLDKWVMFYGGGLITLPSPFLPNCGVLELFARSACKDVDLERQSIYMRTADQPWGPWSVPQQVLEGGDPADPDSGQFGPGGVLHHPDCKGETCATHTQSPYYNEREYGFLYSANIIREWTQAVDGGVDLIWNASTWDPYRVVLLRTRLSK